MFIAKPVFGDVIVIIDALIPTWVLFPIWITAHHTFADVIYTPFVWYTCIVIVPYANTHVITTLI